MSASSSSLHPARDLAGAIEPFSGQVYFSPECHEAYAALGFEPSPTANEGVAMPDGPAYFTSRGSVMGQVPGEVVAAAFGVFNPAAVVPSVAHGWTLTDAVAIRGARATGAVGQLGRILGPDPDGLGRALELLRRATDTLEPAGKPLFAGLVAAGPPPTPLGEAWWRTDQLREYRGDGHVAAWTAAGFDAVEVGMLTELYWGLPSRSYVRTRAWTDEDLDAAEQRLGERGLMADGTLTEAGRDAREAVEVATDDVCRPILEALADDLGELVGIIGGWSAQVCDAGGYPSRGPHELAERAAR